MRALFIALCISLQVYAAPVGLYESVTRDASDTNIPDDFTSAGASFLTSLSPRRNNICAINDTGTNIWVCFSKSAAASCAENGSLYVPDGGGECRDGVFIASNIWVKGAGAITTGKVHLGVW